MSNFNSYEQHSITNPITGETVYFHEDLQVDISATELATIFNHENKYEAFKLLVEALDNSYVYTYATELECIEAYAEEEGLPYSEGCVEELIEQHIVELSENHFEATYRLLNDGPALSEFIYNELDNLRECGSLHAEQVSNYSIDINITL